MKRKSHNPERRVWRGRSYKKGRRRIRELRYNAALKTDQEITS